MNPRYVGELRDALQMLSDQFVCMESPTQYDDDLPTEPAWDEVNPKPKPPHGRPDPNFARRWAAKHPGIGTQIRKTMSNMFGQGPGRKPLSHPSRWGALGHVMAGVGGLLGGGRRPAPAPTSTAPTARIGGAFTGTSGHPDPAGPRPQPRAARPLRGDPGNVTGTPIPWTPHDQQQQDDDQGLWQLPYAGRWGHQRNPKTPWVTPREQLWHGTGGGTPYVWPLIAAGARMAAPAIGRAVATRAGPWIARNFGTKAAAAAPGAARGATNAFATWAGSGSQPAESQDDWADEEWGHVPNSAYGDYHHLPPHIERLMYPHGEPSDRDVPPTLYDPHQYADVWGPLSPHEHPQLAEQPVESDDSHNPEFVQLMQHLRINPQNWQARLVLADWLDEHGHSGWAVYHREVAQRHQQESYGDPNSPVDYFAPALAAGVARAAPAIASTVGSMGGGEDYAGYSPFRDWYNRAVGYMGEQDFGADDANDDEEQYSPEDRARMKAQEDAYYNDINRRRAAQEADERSRVERRDRRPPRGGNYAAYPPPRQPSYNPLDYPIPPLPDQPDYHGSQLDIPYPDIPDPPGWGMPDVPDLPNWWDDLPPPPADYGDYPADGHDYDSNTDLDLLGWPDDARERNRVVQEFEPGDFPTPEELDQIQQGWSPGRPADYASYPPPRPGTWNPRRLNRVLRPQPAQPTPLPPDTRRAGGGLTPPAKPMPKLPGRGDVGFPTVGEQPENYNCQYDCGFSHDLLESLLSLAHQLRRGRAYADLDVPSVYGSGEPLYGDDNAFGGHPESDQFLNTGGGRFRV